MSSELALLNPDKKYVERRTTRWLLVFYDLISLAVVFSIVVILQPMFKKVEDSLDSYIYLIQFAILVACVFVPRAIFKVYKQVLRYGNNGAYARLLASDFLASSFFIGSMKLFMRSTMSIERAALIVSLDFAVVISFRITYCFIYAIASKNTKSGRRLGRILRFVGRVDMESQDSSAVVKMFEKQSINFSSDSIIEVRRVLRQFEIVGNVTSIEQINKGYINRTYHIATLSERGHVHNYLLQRINTNVFPDVEALMHNFLVVTNHLKTCFSLPGRPDNTAAQSIKVSKDGKPYFVDDSGAWRITSYIDDVFSLDIPDCDDTFYEAGKAFGCFVKAMSDVDPNEINVIIPDFHNTMKRYKDLEKAIELDPVGRVKNVGNEIAFIRAKSHIFDKISSALDNGEIPYRVCHNDCNLNNILFDKNNGKPVAIIDLDTVMPSSPLYDFGDSIRIGVNTALDDEPDLSKVSCDLKLYECYAKGYLEASGDMFTQKELELLPYAAEIITMEDGIRFLMDYINGDTYYTIYYEDQNLRRSRTQLKLADDIETHMPEIRKILQKIYNEYGLNAVVDKDKRKK